jgi:hypothetical protein
MVKFFRSERLQQDFEADGFVTTPVLSDDEVAAVTRHCSLIAGERLGRSEHRGLYLGLVDEEDVTRRRTVVQEVHSLVGNGLLRALHPCRLLLGTYLIKPAGAPHTAPHQDPTMTDAHVGTDGSLTAWIALRDVNLETGALGIIKASHTFSSRVVGTPVPAFRTLSQGHEAMLFRYLTFVPVKAGEAVVFDTRCIHGAMPNVTFDPRAVVAVRITPRQVQLYQFFLKPGTMDRLLKLKVTEDYLVRYRPQDLYQIYQQGSVPGYCEVEEELKDDFTPFQRSDLEALCRRHGAVDNGIAIDAAGAA